MVRSCALKRTFSLKRCAAERIGRRLRDRTHVDAGRAGIERGELLEAGPRRCRQRDWKLERVDASQARREVIDRIVRAGQRSVPAGAGRFEAEGQVGFFARPHFEVEWAAVSQVAAAAVEIDDQIGVDQISVFLEQEGRSFASPPASSSAVKAKMRSRSGVYRSRFNLTSDSVMAASPSFMSMVPRP